MDQQRLSAATLAPDGYKALLGVESYVRQCGLDKRLLHLIKMRASQLNGCAFCLDMHAKQARDEDESEQRLYLLNAWREAPIYTPRERAALAWTEAVTHIADTHAPDDVYQALRAQFSDKEIVDLTIAIGMINLWNRAMISFRAPPAAATTKAA